MLGSILRPLRGWLPWLPFALVAYGPVAWLVARTFGIDAGDPSIAAYLPLVGSDEGAAARRSTLWNSVLLAGAISAAAVLVGVPFAFLVTRTDLAFRRVYSALAVVPLLLPPYLAGIAWVQLVPMRGLPAIVFILGGALWPVVALLSAKAFRDVSADAEDAARLALGSGTAFRRVTLALARGGIVAGGLLVFVFALSDFVVPDFFSFAVQSESTFQVFATEIYGAFARQRDPIAAAAFGVPLIAVAAVALLLLGRAEPIRSVASLAGAHADPRPYRLGRWRFLSACCCAWRPDRRQRRPRSRRRPCRGRPPARHPPGRPEGRRPRRPHSAPSTTASTGSARRCAPRWSSMRPTPGTASVMRRSAPRSCCCWRGRRRGGWLARGAASAAACSCCCRSRSRACCSA
jgi:ABC-type Fe3+ transport system permease subunit